MGEFAKPQVLIDLEQYNILLEEYNKDDKCEIETKRVADSFKAFVKNLIQVSGHEVLSNYNCNPLSLYYITRLPSGEIEIKDRY